MGKGYYKCIGYDFWSKYVDGDEIKRLEMSKDIAKIIDACSYISDYDKRIYCISSFLKSYFDDILDFCKKYICIEILDD